MGLTSGAGEGTEMKGWDPLEKDHSFRGGGAFSQSQLSGAAEQSEASRVRNWALFFALHTFHFLESRKSMASRVQVP